MIYSLKVINNFLDNYDYVCDFAYAYAYVYVDVFAMVLNLLQKINESISWSRYFKFY
jgi:hypothetical protein